MGSRVGIGLFSVAALAGVTVLAGNAQLWQHWRGHFSLVGGDGHIGILPVALLLIAVFYIKLMIARGYHVGHGALAYKAYVPRRSPESRPFSVTDDDKGVFEELFVRTQEAWSKGDLDKLHSLLAPPLFHRMDDDLADNASHAIAHKLEQVTLDYAKVVDAWQEMGMDYVVAWFEWSAYSFMVRPDRSPYDSDYVAIGSRVKREKMKETWIFSRRLGKHWLVSSIEKAA